VAPGCGGSNSSTNVVVSPVPVAVGSSTDADIMVTRGSGEVDHRLTAASCDDGCVVTMVRQDTGNSGAVGHASTVVNVHLLRPGTFTLRYKLTTSDGEDLDGSHSFTAIEPTEVTLERNGVQVKPDDTVLEGAALAYNFAVFGPAHSSVVYSWEGLSLTFDGLDPVSASLGDATTAPAGSVLGYPQFVARHAGVGTISIHAGTAIGTEHIRIAATKDVVSTTLHRKLEGNELLSGQTYESAPFDGATWDDQYGLGVKLVPVSTLVDGTLAVGGSDGCNVPSTPGVHFGSGDGLSFGVDSDEHVEATVTVSCVIGAAHAETSVHLKGFGVGLP
jgi:hypothetical protein